MTLDTLKRYAISSLTTFIGTFLGVLSLQITNGVPLQFTTSFILSLLAVAGRAGVKAVVEAWVGQHADTPTA